VALIVITYVYFLIFAQFGFLKGLALLPAAAGHLRLILGGMALGGVGASLLFPKWGWPVRPAGRLRLALGGCAAAAVLSLLPGNLPAAIAAAVLIGISVGALTVTLVAHLRAWIIGPWPLLQIGAGVGLGYAICNHPRLFEATPGVIAVFSALICLLGWLAAAWLPVEPVSAAPAPPAARGRPLPQVLIWFAILVWLDSAAFYIIQHTPALREGTWAGTHRLWQIGATHLAGAVAAGCLLAWRGLTATLWTAFGLLAGACLLVGRPGAEGWVGIAYPLGVSLYSVALVAYPAFLGGAGDPAARGLLAGRLYALAGWVASGLGIGMAEDLGRVPAGFVAAAGLLFAAPALRAAWAAGFREITVGAGLAASAWFLSRPPPAGATGARLASPAERGREVYVSEGCIHCHSQYVRPLAADELMWGPAAAGAPAGNQTPPLIGNRRQGPDLARVGNRRSAVWLKAHFIDPRAFSPGSAMPSYRHLFADGRGDALVAYLQTLGAGSTGDRLMGQASWQPEAPSAAGPGPDPGGLIERHCLGCHSTEGPARIAFGGWFKRPPPDLMAGPFVYVPAAAEPAWRRLRLAQLIKFGLPGTDMPGHEYLNGREVAAMADVLARWQEKGHP